MPINNINLSSSQEKDKEESINSCFEIEKQKSMIDKLKEKAKKQEKIDSIKAKILSDEIKKNQKLSIIWEVFKNGNINITNEVIIKFIHYGKEMGFSSSSPISRILKQIWENYLSKSQFEPIWFLMIYEQLKESIKKWVYDWWKNEWKEIKEDINNLENDINIFLAIYPKLLEVMFWKQIWENLKKQFKWLGIHITKDLENEVLLYYKEKDKANI